MTPPPVALGLFLCNLVIIDQESQMPSLVGIFTGLRVDRFPSESQRFSAFAALTNGRGTARMELNAVRLATGEEIFSQTVDITFPDPLRVVNVHVRVSRVVFPAPGVYEFTLLVEDEVVARRRLRVYQGNSNERSES